MMAAIFNFAILDLTILHKKTSLIQFSCNLMISTILNATCPDWIPNILH